MQSLNRFRSLVIVGSRNFPAHQVLYTAYYIRSENARMLLIDFEGHKLPVPIRVSYALPKLRQWTEVARRLSCSALRMTKSGFSLGQGNHG